MVPGITQAWTHLFRRAATCFRLRPGGSVALRLRFTIRFPPPALRFPARRAADSIPIPNRVLQHTEAGLYVANPVG